MWSYSFTVFLSAFQLLPTAPFHILALGRQPVEAGLFLGFLTYASAVSAPITGAIADRIGKRRVLIVASLAITVFSLLYAVAPSYQVILGLVLVHGVFWSGLLSSSSSYVTRHRARSRGAPRASAIPALPASWRRGGTVDRLVALRSRRLAAAVPRGGGAQPDHGGDRLDGCRRTSGTSMPPLSMHPSDLVEWPC